MLELLTYKHQILICFYKPQPTDFNCIGYDNGFIYKLIYDD